MESERPRSLILALIVLSQFAGTSLWFAGNAIVGDLQLAWGLEARVVAWVTSAVQLGFICGTMLLALTMLADRWAPHKLFCAAALSGALLNLVPLVAPGLWPLLAARFGVGLALAGIYPVGMKLAASWFQRDLGRALGLLVGALVLGTAAPHLLRGIGAQIPWRAVLVAVSILAACGGLVVWRFVPQGPYVGRASRFEPGAIVELARNTHFRSAALGYVGHMWELYAFWAFVPAILAAYLARQDIAFSVSLGSAAVIAAGALGCSLGGALALKLGSARVAAAQLVLSGLLAATLPWWSNLGPLPFAALLLGWGVVVVGDSPQFSTLNALTAPKDRVGSGLTIVTALGFATTIASIELLGTLSASYAIEQLTPILAAGPLMGLIAMQPLHRHDPSRP